MDNPVKGAWVEQFSSTLQSLKLIVRIAGSFSLYMVILCKADGVSQKRAPNSKGLQLGIPLIPKKLSKPLGG